MFEAHTGFHSRYVPELPKISFSIFVCMLMPKIQAFGLIWERSRRTRPGTLCGLVQVQMPSSTNPYRPLMKTKWHPRDERILPRLHFGKLDDNEKHQPRLAGGGINTEHRAHG